MSQITHDNHFVPQLYLKQWSDDGHKLWAYRLLVSNQKVPKWKLRAIRGIAYQRDLYTLIKKGQEVDEFEKWIEKRYEQPAQESIQKDVQGNQLNDTDWERLALLLAAQDVRTPTNYLESIDRWEKTLPDLLENTLQDAVKKLEKVKKGEKTDSNKSPFETSLNIKTKVTANKNRGTLQAELLVGRDLWIEQQKFLLLNTAKVLPTHKWSIIQPALGYEWITSDHPVVKLNYYERGQYDLKGGWGNKGTNLFMPLSPKHLLFTQIGDVFHDYIVLSAKETKMVQKLLAERALRWIFARKPIENMTEYRSRHVDAVALQEEEKRWEQWHNEQSSAEQKYVSKGDE